MRSNATYKQKLMAAWKLKSRGALALYEMTRLAVEIFEDQDFRLDQGNADDFRCADYLDAELFAEFGWSFFDLRRMLQQFPAAEAWAAGKLRELHRAATCDAPEGDAVRRPAAPRATQQEVADLTLQVQSLTAQRDFEATRLREQTTTLDEALAEIARLREKLARAEDRIAELQRQLADAQALV